ncbi:phospholipase [Micromonospora sp. NBC_01813]|uniref:phospholipase n=1 Tax=Micromonospora sp. NBC_01813 TaxID=2975988 RepID=UPI002DDA97F1|nr:phospholipase [Micromonospora sp. NBC_01813]WSA08394.1 phospholipase [Micromonospora sp. NBC_01813]
MHEHSLAPSETASVVLDIGGDMGALIIYTGQEFHGREIEVSRIPDEDQADPAPRTHAAVRERQVHDGVFFSAVITDLRAGSYTVWREGDVPAGQVRITGGAVTEFVWPQHATAGRLTPRPAG